MAYADQSPALLRVTTKSSANRPRAPSVANPSPILIAGSVASRRSRPGRCSRDSSARWRRREADHEWTAALGFGPGVLGVGHWGCVAPHRLSAPPRFRRFPRISPRTPLLLRAPFL